LSEAAQIQMNPAYPPAWLGHNRTARPKPGGVRFSVTAAGVGSLSSCLTSGPPLPHLPCCLRA